MISGRTGTRLKTAGELLFFSASMLHTAVAIFHFSFLTAICCCFFFTSGQGGTQDGFFEETPHPPSALSSYLSLTSLRPLHVMENATTEGRKIFKGF